MCHIDRLLKLTSLLLFAILSAPSEAALVTYSYKGNPFDLGMGFTLDGPVLIELTIEDALIPKNGRFVLPTTYLSISSVLPFTHIYIDDLGDNGDASEVYPYSLPDWAQESSYGRSISIAFNTDAKGNIREWDILSQQHIYPDDQPWLYAHYSVYSYSNGSGLGGDYYSIDVDGGTFFTGTASPGTWTRTVVPLPGSMMLFGSALAGFFYKIRSARHYQS
jgi:hypothetical protein